MSAPFLPRCATVEPTVSFMQGRAFAKSENTIKNDKIPRGVMIRKIRSST